MSFIPKITSYIDKACTKPLKWAAKTKGMKYVGKQFQMDNQKFMTGIGVTSIVLKDGLGCYMYVTQSLNNKKIPEDKRKFVAALDLTNGGLMIAAQLLMFFSISNPKFQKKMFGKMFGKYFDRAATKGYKIVLQNKEKLNGLSGKKFHTAMKKYRGDVETAFGHLTSLIAATMIGKRIIVPFIATPLADKAKAWMSRNDKPAEVHKDTKNTYDTNTPAAEKAKTASSNLLDKYKSAKA